MKIPEHSLTRKQILEDLKEFQTKLSKLTGKKTFHGHPAHHLRLAIAALERQVAEEVADALGEGAAEFDGQLQEVLELEAEKERQKDERYGSW